MNREIKFRVFFYDGADYSTGEMVDFEYAFSENFIEVTKGGLYPTDECSILMQYTGLKDKNGVEIYEGDIVEWDLNYRKLIYDKEIGVVKWDEENVYYYLISNKQEDNKLLYSEDCLKVIGNIYENPELLTTN